MPVMGRLRLRAPPISVPVGEVGPGVEFDSRFPDRVNLGFAADSEAGGFGVAGVGAEGGGDPGSAPERP